MAEEIKNITETVVLLNVDGNKITRYVNTEMTLLDMPKNREWLKKISEQTECSRCDGSHNVMLCPIERCDNCGGLGHWNCICEHSLVLMEADRKKRGVYLDKLSGKLRCLFCRGPHNGVTCPDLKCYKCKNFGHSGHICLLE